MDKAIDRTIKNIVLNCDIDNINFKIQNTKNYYYLQKMMIFIENNIDLISSQNIKKRKKSEFILEKCDRIKLLENIKLLEQTRVKNKLKGF